MSFSYFPWLQAFVKYMEEKKDQQKARDDQRSFQENLTTAKQMTFMKCVLMVMVSRKLDDFYASTELTLETDDAASRIKDHLKDISGMAACATYCQGAFECQIPMHSSLDLFQQSLENEECVEYIIARILDSDKISDEENCYVASLKAIVTKE